MLKDAINIFWKFCEIRECERKKNKGIFSRCRYNFPMHSLWEALSLEYCNF